MNQNRHSYIFIRLFIIWTILFSMTACAYHFGDTRDSATRRIGSLAITPFRNLSFETGAGDAFTEAARCVFAVRGGFEIKTEDKASYVLKGRILSAQNRTAALRNNSGSNRSGVVLETVEVELRLEDSTGSLIKECRIVDKADSLGGEYPGDAASNRSVALKALAEAMMQRAYNELFEGF